VNGLTTDSNRQIGKKKKKQSRTRRWRNLNLKSNEGGGEGARRGKKDSVWATFNLGVRKASFLMVERTEKLKKMAKFKGMVTRHGHKKSCVRVEIFHRKQAGNR